jgi:3-hydroxybutyryl-CoA dehydrogenase
MDGAARMFSMCIRRAQYGAPPLLLRMVEAGLLGKKSGKGFYSY